jgi:hypothetical protein
MNYVTLVPRRDEARFDAAVASIAQNGTAIWGHREGPKPDVGDQVTLLFHPQRASPPVKPALNVFTRSFNVRKVVQGIVTAVGASVPSTWNDQSFAGCTTKYAFTVTRNQQDVAITATAANREFRESAGKASKRNKVVLFTGRGAFPPVSDSPAILLQKGPDLE